MLRRCLGVAAVALAGCGAASVGMISERIGDTVRNADTQEVQLAKLTSFGWDRFYVFPAGTTGAQLCQFIGAHFGCSHVIRFAAVPPDSQAMVFALHRRLTHVELHALANGRFQMASGAPGLDKDHAVFKVERVANGIDNTVLLVPR